MAGPLVRVETDADGVRTLTLDRPGGHNAIGPDLLAELRDALMAAKDASDVRAFVLTGAGTMFSAGGNLDALSQGLDERDADGEREGLRLASDTVRLLVECPVPTLARVNGAAAGGGLALALACDLRIVHADARLVYAYDRIGLAGDLGINWLLVRLPGPARARTVALGGPVVADRALALGLADACHGDADFDSAVASAARRLARIPPEAARSIKRNLDAAAEQDFATATRQESESFLQLRASPGHREALARMANR